MQLGSLEKSLISRPAKSWLIYILEITQESCVSWGVMAKTNDMVQPLFYS